MKIHLASITRRLLWLVGLAMTLKRVWGIIVPPRPLTRAQEKQRRKRLIEEARKSRRMSFDSKPAVTGS